MAYIPSLFVDRSVEFPGRRVLTEVVGSADTFDVTRAEGTEFAVGTMPDATNLNAEFDKIKVETDAINNSLNEQGTNLLIASTTSSNVTLTLNSSAKFSDFKSIYVEAIYTNGDSHACKLFPVSIFSNGADSYFAWKTVDFRIKYVTDTTISLVSASNYTLKVYGIYWVKLLFKALS